jgi:outer membrane biosynthesis protein TonB
MDGDGYGYRPEGFDHYHHVSTHLVLVLLILLVVGAIAYAAGRFVARRDDLERRALARDVIYRDVRKAIERALKAQGADLINASQHLLDKVRSRVGAVSTLNTALSGPSTAIAKGIAGKITDPPKPPPPPPPPAPVTEQPTTIIVNPPSLITRVNVIEPEPKEKPPEKPPEPEKPKERDMTLKEQLNALRLAVESFSAAWEKAAVDDMLEKLQAAVLDARSEKGDDRH